MTAQIGLFGISEDHIENYQSLDERFIKTKSATFFFEASSDSMFPYIEKNDVLIVDRSLTPIHNQIIIASLDGEMICRRIQIYQKSISLVCENIKYSKFSLTKESDFLIWGVVKAIARDVL